MFSLHLSHDSDEGLSWIRCQGQVTNEGLQHRWAFHNYCVQPGCCTVVITVKWAVALTILSCRFILKKSKLSRSLHSLMFSLLRSVLLSVVFCQWCCLSCVPSRHVAVVTGGKGEWRGEWEERKGERIITSSRQSVYRPCSCQDLLCRVTCQCCQSWSFFFRFCVWKWKDLFFLLLLSFSPCFTLKVSLNFWAFFQVVRCVCLCLCPFFPDWVSAVCLGCLGVCEASLVSYMSPIIRCIGVWFSVMERCLHVRCNSARY